jgi:hypothetical protein
MHYSGKSASLSSTTLFLIVWLGIPSLGSAQQGLTSGRPTQRPTTQTQQVVRPVPRFSGKGKARATVRVDLTAVQLKAIPHRKIPPPLSLLELQQAGDAKIGTPYATLSSGHMREPLKALILAMSPSLVNPEPVDHWGIFFPATEDDPSGSNPFPPALGMNINSQASGSYYLVDCSVSPGIYNVADEGGNKETVTVVENKHLLFHLDQADQGWHYFMITSPDHWQFASCEITRLN